MISKRHASMLRQNPKLFPMQGLAGWSLGRIAQEHGVLTYDDASSTEAGRPAPRLPEYGEKLRILPQHALLLGVAANEAMAGDRSFILAHRKATGVAKRLANVGIPTGVNGGSKRSVLLKTPCPSYSLYDLQQFATSMIELPHAAPARLLCSQQ
jgi:hypothetical protein